MKSTAQSARVAAVSGLVSISSRNVRSRATPNAILHQGDLIETGPNASATLEFGDANRVTLLSESSLRLDNVSSYPEGAGVVETDLSHGRTESEIAASPGSKSRFHIKTPAGITSVRGTQLRVAVLDAVLSLTEVLSGTVTVQNAGREVAVQAGYGTIARKGEPPQAPVPLLSAPDISKMPKVIARVFAPVEFEPVAGAVAYRVQLAGSASFYPILFDKRLSEPKLPFPELPNARYVMRVRAIDAAGLEGYNSEHNLEVAIRPDPPLAIEPADAEVMTNGMPTFRWISSLSARSTQYRLQIARDAEFSNMFIDIPNADNSIMLTQPLPAGRYYWRVAAVNEDYGMSPFSAARSLRIVSPAPPLEMLMITPSQIRMRWSPQTAHLAYHVQLALDDKFIHVVEDRVVAGDALDLERPAPNRYHLRVRAIESDGYEGSYAPRVVDVNPPPPTPQGLYPVDRALSADGMVNFSWQQSIDAQHYHFQLARDILFQQPVVEVSVSEPRFTPKTALEPGLYFWRVAAENDADGRGAFGPPRTVRRLVSAPAHLLVAADSENLSFRWPRDPKAWQYDVELARDETFTAVIARTRTSDSEWRLARPAGGRYFVHIRSVDSDGVPGAFGTAEETDVRSRPSPPRSLSASMLSEGAVLLRWDPERKDARHHLQISSGRSFDALVLDEHQVETANFVVPIVLPPAVYYWRVAESTEADGEGEFSEPGMFRISPEPPQLDSVAVKGNELLFRWREQPGSVQYEIEVASDRQFHNMVINRRTTAANLHALRPPAGTYLVRMRSVDADGVPGTFSNITTFQVPARFPLWLLVPLLIIVI
jgi:hypothetical protein